MAGLRDRLAACFFGDGAVSQAQLDGILERAKAEVAAAVKFAEESPWPADGEVYEDIFV